MSDMCGRKGYDDNDRRQMEVEGPNTAEPWTCELKSGHEGEHGFLGTPPRTQDSIEWESDLRTMLRESFDKVLGRHSVSVDDLDRAELLDDLTDTALHQTGHAEGN